MKFIIIGLGNFGAAMAIKLIKLGHEVMGVDKDLNKVNSLKEQLTYCIQLDATDINAIDNLPLKETDVVIISIGESEGDSIMATAVIKQKFKKRIITRAVTKVQATVFRAMGIEEIVYPEEDAADRLAMRLNIQGIMGHLKIAGNFNIVEARIPAWLDGKMLIESGLMKDYNILVLTTIADAEEKSVLWLHHNIRHDVGVAGPETVLKEGEVMVMYGNIKDIKKVLEKE